jgi:AcrR family transcriptional regulator
MSSTAPVAERGRPRAFDTDTALDAAIQVFWRHGYEGASLAALTDAMRINRPSLYAAFGNKEQLFQQAVRRYAAIDMAYVRSALEQPTARAVAESFLLANAAALTRPDRPAGCLSIQGGLSAAADSGSTAAFLASSRLAGEHALAARFRRSVTEGDLPADSDPDVLARFVMALSEGHAVHAAAGVPREQLEASARLALAVFPAA